MKSLTVTTKEELKKAQNEEVDEIIIIGDLAGKLKKSKKITKLGVFSMAALMAAISVGIGGVATAPTTGGLSLGFTAASAGTAATITGLEIATIIFISTMGIGLIIALFKDYEEIEFSKGKMILRKRHRK